MKKSFLTYLKAFTLVGVMASILAITSCSSDDSAAGPTETIWELLESNSNLSSLQAEFAVFSDIEATLSDEDANITLFAPSNAALNTLLQTLGLSDFSTVSDEIAQAVLTYHIVTSAAISSGELEGSITTSQGEAISVTSAGALSTGATSDAEVQTADIAAVNGVIHIVDVVLVPPTIGAQIVATLGTLAQPVFLGADFTILASAINKADAAATDPTATITAALIGDLTDDTPSQLTVFAPTNATFEGANPPITADTYDAATWDAIIRNHVVLGDGAAVDADDQVSIGASDLVQDAVFYSLIGVPLSVSVGTPTNGLGIFLDSDLDQIPNAEVALPDAATARNGRIHVIAGVLAPPQ